MIQIGGKIYELIHENRNGWNADAFKDRYSEVLERYDFIIGDWGYSQLRLKGFFRDNHMKATKDSAYSGMSDYINEYCNFGCPYFVLEKTGTIKKSTDDEEAGEEQDAALKQDTYVQEKMDAEDEQDAAAASLADAVLAGAAAAARESAAAGRGSARNAEDSQQQPARQQGHRGGRDQHRRSYRPNGKKPIKSSANKDVAAASEQAAVHAQPSQKPRDRDKNKEHHKEQGSRQS
ncbi:Uncharacterized protein YutD [Paenibacillus catalpae]|uniref:Uncharacterized protein YutD n=1 Tax=Paenibacillus catalpae TaxID=1045775 RepID=A0A1I2ACD6_9BACL|nr:YutD family protein [Paenibacillus catalpae]SFE41469.1 Uncharacterized protein YutD [Paenibacillus catalpae]